MVEPGGSGSNNEGKLGGVNIAGGKGEEGKEGQPIGNWNNNRIGEVGVNWGRTEILGQRRKMPRWE